MPQSLIIYLYLKYTQSRLNLPSLSHNRHTSFTHPFAQLNPLLSDLAITAHFHLILTAYPALNIHSKAPITSAPSPMSAPTASWAVYKFQTFLLSHPAQFARLKFVLPNTVNRLAHIALILNWNTFSFKAPL